MLTGAPLQAYTPVPIPPTSEQIAAVHELLDLIRPWDAAPTAEMQANVAQWLNTHHHDSTEIQRQVFELKIRDLYRKAIQAPDALTSEELYAPYRHVREEAVRSLIVFLKSSDGYVFQERFDDLAVRSAGAQRQILPKLPEIFAAAVDSAAHLEKVNQKKR